MRFDHKTHIALGQTVVEPVIVRLEVESRSRFPPASVPTQLALDVMSQTRKQTVAISRPVELVINQVWDVQILECGRLPCWLPAR